MDKKVALLLAIFLLIFLPSISLAQAANYLPLSKDETGKPFPLKKEATIDSADSISFTIAAGPSGIHFDSHVGSQPDLVASGQDKYAKPWRVVISEVSGFEPVDFFIADLDKNGISDVVIMMPTGGNGLAPTVHLVIIMFDNQGRPIPFEADGYFEPEANGIDSLVDMNGDGKAELIYMNFNDGYWITNIYSCNNGRWSRVQGKYGKRDYPLFTRFTNRPNKKAATPEAKRRPFAPTLSNDKPLSEGFLVSFHIPDKSTSDAELTFEDSSGSLFKCTPSYWYDSARVVFDSPAGRQIAHLASEDKENAETLLNQIIKKKIKVLLYGQRYSDKCSPETTWASESN